MEPHRKHQENEDCFLKYIAKKVKVLTKKLDVLSTASAPIYHEVSYKNTNIEIKRK
jgi:hypothetical protein